MKKRILFFTAILLLAVSNFYGQSNRPILTPPTPEVASLGRFIDQPMSLSRGIPDISIPIYNLKVSTELSYPINLKYHAGGIQVTEMASKVGLGWNMQETGMITRTVKDFPDEIAGVGYMYTPKTIPVVKLMVEDANSNLASLKETFDTEPDEYVVTVNGLYLKFYYDRENEKFVQAPLSKTKIEPQFINSKIVSWTITDTNGIKYFFGNNGAVEISNYTQSIVVTSSSSQSGTMPEHIASWYLTKIEDTKSNKVEFQYKESEVYNLYNKVDESFIRDFMNGNGNGLNVPFKRSYTYTQIRGKSLEKIKTNNTEILFTDDVLFRKDITKSKALKEIKIIESNKDLKKIIFDYDYFTANNTQPYDSYSYFPEDKYRLKLTAVNIYEGIQATPQKYSFEYNTTDLPNRYSYSQDAWGFYNGKNNTELIPRLSTVPITGVNSFIGSANRTVSVDNAKAGILTKIKYPTGGFTTYDYESNTVSQVVNLTYPYNFSETITKNFWLEAETIITPENVSVLDKPEYRSRLSVKRPSGEITLNINVEGCTSQLNNSNCQYQIKIVGVNNSYYATMTQSQLVIQLPEGEYDVVATKSTGTPSEMFGFVVTAYWNEFLEDSALGQSNQIVGGLRVKKVNFYDSNNQLSFSNQYEYTEKNSENRAMSSGRLLDYPIFVDKQYYELDNSFRVSSNSIFPLSNLGVHSVIYTNVIESRIDTNGSTLGKTEYSYSFDNKSDNAFYNQFGTLKRDRTSFVFSWRNGLLLSKKSYDNQGIILRQEINDYSSKNKIILNNFGAFFDYRMSTLPTQHGESVPFYRYQFYPLVTDTYNMDKSEITDYYNGKEVKKSIEYFYNNASHYQLTKQKNTFSDGTVNETIYDYAHEKNNQLMISNNMIGFPLKTTTNQIIGSATKTVSKTETIYPETTAEITNNSGGLILPKSVLSFDLQNPNISSTEITYDKYDSKGNLQQYTSKDGLSTTIIWGYSNTQPIAKIEGAKLSDISQTLIDSIVNASANDAQVGTDVSEQSMISALDLFRNNSALSGYQITTYSYDPLIGVKSITPPSGIREVYTYDTANRLEKVIDVNGKVLKEYKYNYKN
ncbi:SpvB/TcaC N-terminal domain-containing protein [Chryseobacterium phocaeense]|uniref:SpvB/TcaC N-terminal domain-containing protein n=1 Tax=Chryseobacterium phocaeense TaxID=1816690 RepID=UPI0011193390|nr:SpvB/TcaC N-terminal domain-containing protein [Chryseobacterium phocaeense]